MELGTWLSCGGHLRLPRWCWGVRAQEPDCPSLGASPREKQTLALTISPGRSL